MITRTWLAGPRRWRQDLYSELEMNVCIASLPEDETVLAAPR